MLSISEINNQVRSILILIESLRENLIQQKPTNFIDQKLHEYIKAGLNSWLGIGIVLNDFLFECELAGNDEEEIKRLLELTCE